MELNITELKLLVGWAAEKRNDAYGSRISEPDRYNNAVKRYDAMTQLFNLACEQRINEILINTKG